MKQNPVHFSLLTKQSTNPFSLQKYAMLSPQRRHPIECNLASFVEYINGFIPDVYRLSAFDRLTIENLELIIHI